jgi:hypothetical protein
MSSLRKIIVLLLVLLAFGALRLKFERQMLTEFRDAGLMREQNHLESRDRIDQTSSAVALGGLRTLVATFLNLRAHGYFERQAWNELQDTYETIVNLAPQTRYYWETGSWHMAYNAASYYLHESSRPPLRRKELWRSSILQGRYFLERGIGNNPRDWSLHASLGHMLRDPNKLPAMRDRDAALMAAHEAYDRSVELGCFSPMLNQRLSLYCLARVRGRESEALELARTLHEDPRHHKPTLLILLYVLEFDADPDQDAGALALRIFGDAKTAYEALAHHWRGNREGYPMDGVAQGLARMEGLLGIPPLQSILGQKLAPGFNPDDWFK